MKPTPQQENCVTVAKTANLLKISACAGGSKTTTLTLIAEDQPVNSIYLAFNKVTATEASEKFPSHVVCRTTHSVAYAQYGFDLAHKLTRPKAGYVNVGGTGGEISRIYKIKEVLAKDGSTLVTESGVGQFVKECVAKFEQSADLEIGYQHLPFHNMGKVLDDCAVNLKDIVLKNAKRLWEDRINPQSIILATHDTYLKLFQLSKPKLKYNTIYLDEAQDSTPCVLDIVLQQKNTAKIVLVGDARQSIYQWRGSVNAMKVVEGQEAFLGQSFRYGQAIADVAMAVLKHTVTIEGFDKIPSEVKPVDTSKPYTKLFRTNSAMLAEAVSSLERGVKIELEVDTKDFVKLLQSIDALYSGNMKGVKHEKILPYPTWYSLVNAETDDRELKRMVKIVSDGACDRFISVLENYRKPAKADVIFTTAHKSKGREWDQVVLAEDFPSHYNKDGEYVGLNETEENLLYVAVTRVKLVLQINSSVKEAIDYVKPPVKETA